MPPLWPLLKRARRSCDRLIFGDDIFISYSRLDGATYSAGLAGQLAADRFATKLDQWGTQPGEEIPNEIMRALARSSLLVVVATRGAGSSRGVEQEIRAFLETGRYIVPVDVDGEIEKASWWPLLRGLPVTREVVHDAAPDDPKTTGNISAAVVGRIEKLFDYVKKDRRLRRVTSVMIMVLAILLTAVLYAGNKAVTQTAKAADATIAANEAKLNRDRALFQAKSFAAQAEAAEDRQKEAKRRAEDARTAELEARAAETTAKSEAAAADRRKEFAERRERRADLNLQANSALVNGDPLRALEAAEAASRIEDTPATRLLLAQLQEEGLPLELVGLERTRDVAVSPVNADIIAAIGTVGGRSRLMLWDLAVGTRVGVEEPEFYAIEFAPDGQSLFAAALTKVEAEPGPAMGRKVSREVSLIKFDLSLRRISAAAFGPIEIDEGEGTEAWDVRDVQDLVLDRAGQRLVMAGFAAPTSMGFVSNPGPHHWCAWASLDGLRVTSNVDTQHELSAQHDYHGHVVLLAEDGLVVDGTNEVYVVDMASGERSMIGKHPMGITDLDASPQGLHVAAVGGDARISVFTRSTSGKWEQEIIDIGGDAEIEQVRFIAENRLVVANTDLELVSVTIGGAAGANDVILDGQLTWREPRRKSFIGHTAEISEIIVSSDGRWIASTSADRTARLWSAVDDRRRTLRGSRLGVMHARFSSDSRRFVTASMDGVLRVYEVDPPEHFVISVHPGDERIEPRISDRDWTQGGDLTRDILRENWGFVRELSWNDRGELEAETYDRVTTRWDSEFRLIGTTRKPVRTMADIPPVTIRKWVEVTPDRRPIVHDGEPVDEKREATAVISPEGHHLLWFSYADRSVYVWESRDLSKNPVRLEMVDGSFIHGRFGEEIAQHFVRFSPDGRWAAFPVLYDRKYAMALVGFDRMHARVFPGDFTGSAFDISTTGEIAAGARTGKLFVLSPSGETRVFPPHAAAIRSVAFSPDGNWIGTAADDRTVRLWSAATGDFEEHRLLNTAVGVLFSQDSQQILAASGRAIHAWYVPSGSLDSVFDTLARSGGGPASVRARLQKVSAPEQSSERISSPLVFLVHKPLVASREQAIRATLSNVPPPTAERLNALVATLISESAHRNRRIAAALELTLHGAKVVPFVRAIAPALRRTEGDTAVPEIVLDLLRGLGPPALNGLVTAVDQARDPGLRRDLTNALADIGQDSPEVRDTLRRLERDENSDVVVAAALAIARFSSDEETLAILGQALFKAHEHADAAAEALGSKHAAGAHWLLRALDAPRSRYADPPDELARKALAATGREVVPLVLASLREQTGDAKVQRIRVLGAMGETAAEAVPDLITLIRAEPVGQDRGSATVSAAISALGSIGPGAASAIPYLIDILLDERRPQLEASFALKRMGSGAIEPLTAVLPKTRGAARNYAAEALGEFGAAAATAVPALCRALAEDHDYEIAEAIGKIGPGAATAVPYLIAELPRNSGFGRSSVLKALDEIHGDPDTIVPAIVEVLDKESQRPPQPLYLITPDVLSALKAESLPQNILTELEEMNDGTYRPLEYFGPIISRRIGAENMQRYGTTIIAKSEIQSLHRCDEERVFETAIDVLVGFGRAAASAIPALEAIRSRLPLCEDISSQIDRALEALGT